MTLDKNYGWNCCWKRHLALWLLFAHLNFYNAMFSFRFGHREATLLGIFYCARIHRLKKNLFGFTCAIPGTKMIRRKKTWAGERMRKREGSVKFRKNIFAHQLAMICSSSCQDKKEELHNERKSIRVAYNFQCWFTHRI